MDGAGRGRLLLVEDEARLRELITGFLRMERYEVVEAEDGLRGVERFGDSGPFDLVIVDLDLPRLPGVEVCRQIKSSLPTQSILVCSGAILDVHCVALDELGIAQILTKPYLPARLLREIAQSKSNWPVRGLSTGAIEPSRIDPGESRFASHSTDGVPHSLVKSARSK